MHLALLAKNKTKSESPTDTLHQKNKGDSTTIKRAKNVSVSSSSQCQSSLAALTPKNIFLGHSRWTRSSMSQLQQLK